MTIEKLEEFASNGDKHLTGLDVATGFPRADKPERPWFNKLFGDITGKINEVVDNIDALPPFEGGVLADTFVTVTPSNGTVARNLRDVKSDLVTINDFATVSAAQNYAVANNAKIFVPSGEHLTNTTPNLDLFWGNGTIKDTTTDISYTPVSDNISQSSIGATVYANNYGLISGSTAHATHNSNVMDILQALITNTGVMKFGAGDYSFAREINLTKSYDIIGAGKDNTILRFPNQTNGIVRNRIYGKTESLTLKGSKSEVVINPLNNVYGNIGLKDVLDGSSNAAYNTLRDINVEGFDCGRVIAQEGTAAWAGSYREVFNANFIGNRYGVVYSRGATLEKYFGGLIAANDEVGLYVHGHWNYFTLSIFGTIIEGNPLTSETLFPRLYGGYVTETATNKMCNAYIHGTASMNVFGGYFEHGHIVVEDGARVAFLGGTRSETAPVVSLNGSVLDDDGGYMGYAANVNTYPNMNTWFYAKNKTYTTTKPCVDFPRGMNIRVSGATSGVANATRAELRYQDISDKNINTRDVVSINMTLKIRVNSAPANARLKLSCFVYDAKGGYIYLSLPPTEQIDKIIDGAVHTVRMERIVSVTIPAEAYKFFDNQLLSHVEMILIWSDKDTGVVVDTSATAIDYDILGMSLGLNVNTPNVEFGEFRMKEVLSLVSAAIPPLTLADMGYSIYESVGKHYNVWNGSAWVKLTPVA